MKRWNERNLNPEQVLVDIPEIVDRMRSGVDGMIVFGPDSDAWLKARTFPQRAGVGTLIPVAGAFQDTPKSIYYWRFLLLIEVCA